MFKKYIFTLIIGTGIALILSCGIAKAIEDKVYISGLVEKGEFLSMGGILQEFSTKNRLYEYTIAPFTVKFKNTGQTQLKPSGKIIIKNTFGQEIGQIPVNQAGLATFAGQSQWYESLWQKDSLLGLGKYSADLVLSYGTEEVLGGKIYFWIFPWRLTLIVIIYFLMVYIFNNLFRHYQLLISAKGWRIVHG